MGEHDDVVMMQSPSQWPLWPVLPVKNREKRGAGNLPVLGLMREGAFGVRPVVYLIDLYGAQNLPPGKSWDDIETADFEDFEAIVDAGWVVD